GVARASDQKTAIQRCRRAAGLSNDFVIIEANRYLELEEAAQKLAVVEEQIKDLQRQLDEARKREKREEQREKELQQQLDQASKQAETQKQDVSRVGRLLRSAATTAPPGPSPANPAGTLGKFYALVIGNAQYEHLPPVASAEHDAKAMEALLRDDYGFQVTTLLNARNTQILKTLYTLSQQLGENDNLVVYYAGHGKRDLRNRRGWWMPVDAGADADAKTNWLPNQEVSDRLALIPAKHILVLADASYVGDITRGAPQQEPQNMTAAQWAKYVETTKQRR